MVLSVIQSIELIHGVGSFNLPAIFKRDGMTIYIRCHGIFLQPLTTQAVQDLCLLYCKASSFRVKQGETYKYNVVAAFIPPKRTAAYQEFATPIMAPLNTAPDHLSFFVQDATQEQLCKLNGRLIIEAFGNIQDNLLL